MSVRYELPMFNAYKPKKLVQLSRKMETIENAFDFSSQRVEKSILKLQSGEILRRKDIKILAYRVDQLEERGLLDKFLNNARQFYSKSQSMYYQVKALLQSFYNLYKSQELFLLLKTGMVNNTRFKEEMIEIKTIIDKSLDLKEFFTNIREAIYSCKTIIELEQKINKLMLKKDTSLLRLILKRRVMDELAAHKNNDFDFHMHILKEYINPNDHKEIFQSLLLSMVDENLEHLDSATENWFIFIGDQLGDPYGNLKTKWIGISEDAKKTFQRRKALKNIKYFFSEITGDRRRLNFWKQYASYFYRVEYFEQYDKALLMETSKYLFVEFAKIGAMYMYRKDVLDISSFEEKFKYRSRTSVVTSVLKNPKICSERMTHTGDWESKFRDAFNNYRYIG
jgi:hypothetical protein